MNAIDVLDGGLLTTVQDLGRTGWQRYGVPVSGRWTHGRFARGTDSSATRRARPDWRSRLRVRVARRRRRRRRGDRRRSGACLNGRPLPLWQAVAVSDGAELAFSGRRTGMRAYLAVAGAIDVPAVLGSRSTLTRAGLAASRGAPSRAATA